MFEENRKRNALAQRLCTTALAHMENCGKETKDIYFSLLDYDNAMYSQKRKELECGTDSSDQLTHGAFSDSCHVRQNQADISSIFEMERDMYQLLTVFMEPESDMRNTRNCWWVRPFNCIYAIGPMQSETDGEDHTDFIFCNMATLVVFHKFIGYVPEPGKKTSVTWARRANDWMES